MGFYDARCMVTGVSLKGSQTALVLLQKHHESYHPIALAITGQYDRLGSIDMIDEDDNTDTILSYFLAQLETKKFVVDDEYLRSHEAFPIETIEQLLRGFERNINDFSEAACLGRPVVFTLISARVWEAIARASVQKESDRVTFDRLFKADSVARAIYAECLDDVTQQLHEFAAISDFLSARHIPWSPPLDFFQHYDDEIRQYLAQAKATFHDSPVVLQGLKAYKREIAELLEE